VLAKADAQHFDGISLRRNRARLAFLRHNEAEMEELLKWAEGKPDADHSLLYDRAMTEAYRGHYTNDRMLLARVSGLAAEENDLPSVNSYLSDGALIEAEAGNLPQALQLVEQELKGPQQRATRPRLALALARSGQAARARELGDSLSKTAPVSTIFQNYYLPTIQAAIAMDAKEPAEAIRILERTKQYDFAYPESFAYLYPADIRGLAYLQLGEGPRAKTEFQKLLDHPGFVGANVIGALSRLHWREP
jgi:hypothetical protein